MTGELSAAQLRTRFERHVVTYLEDLRSQASGDRSSPLVVVYTGGQPGAGKSRANERATQERPSLVPVIGDDLRQFHPDYARLMREDPLSMPAATAQASGRWIGMSADYLRERHVDVLIETTLRSPDAMASTIASFREAGYAVELRAVAVPPEVSRLSTIERYTGQVESAGAGRWTPAAAHDEAFERAVATVEGLVASGAVDRFVIEDRNGTVLLDENYVGLRDKGLAEAAHKASTFFERARSIEQMAPDAARGWIELAHTQIACVRGLKEQDPDLVSTLGRVVGRDAPGVARVAYPGDARAQEQALKGLREAHRPLAKGALGQRIEREVLRRRRVGEGGRDLRLAGERATPPRRGSR